MQQKKVKHGGVEPSCENLILGQLQGMKCTQVPQTPQGCDYLMIATPWRAASYAPLMEGREKKERGVFLIVKKRKMLFSFTLLNPSSWKC